MKDLITTAKGFRARCNSPENLDSTRKKLAQALDLIDLLVAHKYSITHLQIAAGELEAVSKAGLAHRRKLARAAAKIEPNKRRTPGIS